MTKSTPIVCITCMIIHEKIPAVELRYLFAKYCIESTPFLWLSSVYQFRVDK